jgi:hypothetical protein
MPDVLHRAAGVLIALLIVAALAFQLMTQKDLAAAREAAFLAGEKPLPAGQRERVLDDLRSVSDRQPGTEALVTESLVWLRADELGRAEAAARRATEREPDNAAAWLALAAALQASRAPGVARARDRALELDPLRFAPRR